MSLLELCNGYLPAPYPRGRKVSSWKVQRLVQAMVIGIDAEIVDQIVGIIPPNTPLTLEKAARAVGLSKKSARQLQGEAEFQAACLAAVEALRACQEPANIAVAASIRDDRTSRARDRLNAIEVLRGPKPAAGVTVNVA